MVHLNREPLSWVGLLVAPKLRQDRAAEPAAGPLFVAGGVKVKGQATTSRTGSGRFPSLRNSNFEGKSDAEAASAARAGAVTGFRAEVPCPQARGSELAMPPGATLAGEFLRPAPLCPIQPRSR